MDRSRALKEFRGKIRSGELLTGLSCAIPHPGIMELACRTGHDFVLIDAEHTSIDPVTQEHLIRAADVHGMVSLVKVKAVDEVLIREALDAGACGIVAPHIKSAADMRRLIDYACFPTRGKRGLCSAARANYYSSADIRDLVAMTNEDLMIIPIIEDHEAVGNLDEILAVDPAINVFEIGPVDMALSLGLDLDRSITNPSPELVRVLDTVVSTLRARGKKLLYPTRFPNVDASAAQVASDLSARGVALLYGMDTHCINYASRLLASIKEHAGRG